jgi:hypothetical protein
MECTRAYQRWYETRNRDRAYTTESLEFGKYSSQPAQYAWLTWATAIKAAVTRYEVYLDWGLVALAADFTVDGRDLLTHHDPDRTPMFRRLLDAYEAIGVTAQPPEVEEVVKLRNFLTHHDGRLPSSTSAAVYRSLADEAHLEAGDQIPLRDAQCRRWINEIDNRVPVIESWLWKMTTNSACQTERQTHVNRLTEQRGKQKPYLVPFAWPTPATPQPPRRREE